MKTTYFALLLVGLFSMSYVQAEIPAGKVLQAIAEKKTQMIDTAGLKKMLEDRPDMVLVDIRTKHEIKRMGGAIDVPQNVNVPRGWLEFSIQSKTEGRDTPIVVYCGAGLRSPLAADTLQQMGYTNVWNYSEGYFGWKKAHAK